jgi:hypothetical protein
LLSQCRNSITICIFKMNTQTICFRQHSFSLFSLGPLGTFQFKECWLTKGEIPVLHRAVPSCAQRRTLNVHERVIFSPLSECRRRQRVGNSQVQVLPRETWKLDKKSGGENEFTQLLKSEGCQRNSCLYIHNLLN